MSTLYRAQPLEALRIARSIASMYHLTQGCGTADFAANALNQLAEVIEFDSACWLLSATRKPAPYTLIGEHNLPTGFIDLVCPELSLYSASTPLSEGDVNISQKRLPDDSRLGESLCRFSVSQPLIAQIRYANLTHHIIVYKAEPSAEFSDRQVSALAFFIGSMVNAFGQSLQAKLTRNRRHRSSQRAITNAGGLIVEAQPTFTQTVSANLSTDHWDQSYLPTTFDVDCVPSKSKLSDIVIEVFEEDGWYVAEAYPFDAAIESLTPTEQAVAELLVRGKTNKEIATECGNREKTIEHHVKSLCEKLGVSNRTEATKILSNSDHLRFSNNGGR